jgi:hypothetical protein
LLSRYRALTGCSKIGWKFYLAFIIPGSIGGVIMFLYFPDTKGLPLEEIAAIFGDEDDIAVYQREININDGGIIEDRHGEVKGIVSREEDAVPNGSEKRV